MGLNPVGFILVWLYDTQSKSGGKKAPEIMFETRVIGGVQSLRVNLSKVTIN